MSITDYIIDGLGLLTLLAGILFVLILITTFIPKLKSIAIVKKCDDLLTSKALLWGLVISLTATAGSLFFSEIAQFGPCKLCWFQRIFMYPLPILFGVAMYKKDLGIRIYALKLAVIGAVIAAYHYFLQIHSILFPNVSLDTPCSTVGYSPSCSEYFVLNYGYITIVMMSLTAFALIALIMIKSIWKK